MQSQKQMNNLASKKECYCCCDRLPAWTWTITKSTAISNKGLKLRAVFTTIRIPDRHTSKTGGVRRCTANLYSNPNSAGQKVDYSRFSPIFSAAMYHQLRCVGLWIARGTTYWYTVRPKHPLLSPNGRSVFLNLPGISQPYINYASSCAVQHHGPAP